MTTENDDTELDKESTFFTEVESSPDICSNCYRRVRYRYESVDRLPDFASGPMEHEDDVNLEYYDDKVESGRPSIKKATCVCGAADLRMKFRPMGKERVFETSYRIKERLEEEDVDFDVCTFFKSVREKKSNPANQFNEEKLFEEAVEKAVNCKAEENREEKKGVS